jgi:hypothetical protein
MATDEQFLAMTLVRSRIKEDHNGDLIRIETRRCERTGLVLTRTTAVPVPQALMAVIVKQR